MRGLNVLSPRQLVRRFGPIMGGRPEYHLQYPGAALGAAWRGSGNSRPLGRLGELEVRLAASAGEIRRAQALRYQVFYEEMSALPDMRTRESRRDADSFDPICDHMLVLDRANLCRPLLRQHPEIVATYRLLRQSVADRNGGFYSAGEFDIEPLLARHRRLRFLELGRSCVLEPYRDKRTIELMWHGIWAYVLKHGMDVMIGCASLDGTDPDRLALPLSFLHHTAAAPSEWGVTALESRRVEMNRMPLADIDRKAALRALPPLIKGYLRVGAFVGDGAVVDRQFGTTDVCIVLPVTSIAARYVGHYGPDASRYAS